MQYKVSGLSEQTLTLCKVKNSEFKKKIALILFIRHGSKWHKLHIISLMPINVADVYKHE